MKTKISVPFAMLFGFALTLSGADQPKAGTFLTIETAGPDYAVQGEYVNDWGGAQVIALGEDKFRMVLHKGGLPGAGWDGSDKTEIEGKREGETVVFANPNGRSHTLKDGEFVTTTDKGDIYTMKKTMR